MLHHSTGIAYIMLGSQSNARHVVKELNNKYIGHHYIELSVLTIPLTPLHSALLITGHFKLFKFQTIFVKFGSKYM